MNRAQAEEALLDAFEHDFKTRFSNLVDAQKEPNPAKAHAHVELEIDHMIDVYEVAKARIRQRIAE